MGIVDAGACVYWSGAQAAEMRRAGAAFHAIAEHFGVDDHTAGKAVIRPPVP